MATTPEHEFQLRLEELRAANQNVAESSRIKLEVVRLAKEVLIENARNKPTDESGVSAEDITSFADKLAKYVGV